MTIVCTRAKTYQFKNEGSIPPMKTQISIDHWGSKRLVRVLALLLVLAVAPSMLLAQQWGERKGRDKVDPTGAWLLKWGVVFDIFPEGISVLEVFHQGGTLTGDAQGESAFDPAATTNPQSDLNVITTPHSGEWQRTGRNTFAATFMVIEYHVVSTPPGAPILQFSQVQYKGTLTDSNHMVLDAVITHFDKDGNKLQGPPNPFDKFKATGVRIPLKDVDELELPILP
jgi:hypothetical protein